jgi:glutamate-1-semialdehyde-2,1-aminomutase
MKFKNNQNLLKKALKVTPLGSQTYSKSYKYFCGNNAPYFIDRGKGCYVWDVDGNKFLDFICALGPITIGYNDDRINKAITDQLGKGIIFSQASPIEMQLAEKLIQIIPGIEMVRFLKSGSEATTAAVRLARAYTGRDMVAMSGYHGMQDWSIGSTANKCGVPEAICKLTETFEYNNIQSIEQLFEEHKNKIACVILEPIQSDGPKDGYLDELKKITHKNGALLIFDEVVSGFRYALGGAAELYNVTPDLVAFGKGMANGMPISVVAGKKDILELIEKKKVFISTTFGGETLSIAAALATIEILQDKDSYKHIWKLGKIMLEGLRASVKKFNLSDVMIVNGLAPHCGILFEGRGLLDYLDINSVYQQRMLDMNILTLGINNINLSHTENEIKNFLDVADKCMEDVRRSVEMDSVQGILRSGKVDPIFKRNVR